LRKTAASPQVDLVWSVDEHSERSIRVSKGERGHSRA
jgi:hypothetical protein